MNTLSRREWLASSAVLSATLPFCPFAFGQDADPKDARLGPPKTLNDYFPFSVPKTLDAWKARRERIREQIMVANGLWPKPRKIDIKADIHGLINRDGYTIEKVAFESMPGHTVTGNLYRPLVPGDKQKRPAVLFAHGHWENGRLHVESDAAAKKLVETKAEPDFETAKYFMQHLPAMLAKNGMISFQFDMVGYADSTAIGHVAKSGVPHPNGFATVDCELHLHSLMGLQTLNCIRSIDFLESLPDVDPKRIGMTGASGGGTQTFITAAIDDRIAVAAPAVMVSTGMQGGCVCENCSLLRVGTGNVEMAACIAPRPLALTAANDWTKELMTKGYPELQQVYELYGRKDNVTAKAWPEFPHNYNYPARTFVIDWFCKHFLDGKKQEAFEFKHVEIEKLRIIHTQINGSKAGGVEAETLLQIMRLEELLSDIEGRSKLPEINEDMIKSAGKPPLDDIDGKYRAALREKQFDAMFKNSKQNEVNKRNDRAHALRAMLCDELPAKIALRKGPVESKVDGCTVHRAWFGREDEKDALPGLGMFSKEFKGDKVCLWIHPDGRESLFKDEKVVPAARKLIDAGYAVVSADLLGTGTLKFEKPRDVNKTFAAFTWGYNRTLLAERVHDILTITAFAKTMLKATTLHLVGWAEAGPWAGIARSAVPGSTFNKCAIDMNKFDFANIKEFNDPMMLTGALKYGNLDGLLSIATGPLLAYNTPKPKDEVARLRAEINGLDNGPIRKTEAMEPLAVVEWLLK
ncbi:hypothetical protein BH11PLA2_BH11PLA2_05000 [soil metagenome]